MSTTSTPSIGAPLLRSPPGKWKIFLRGMKGYQHVGLRSAPLFRESLPWPETGLMLCLALGRPGRHTEGLLGSIMGLLGWIWRPFPFHRLDRASFAWRMRTACYRCAATDMIVSRSQRWAL